MFLSRLTEGTRPERVGTDWVHFFLVGEPGQPLDLLDENPTLNPRSLLDDNPHGGRGGVSCVCDVSQTDDLQRHLDSLQYLKPLGRAVVTQCRVSHMEQQGTYDLEISLSSGKGT